MSWTGSAALVSARDVVVDSLIEARDDVGGYVRALPAADRFELYYLLAIASMGIAVPAGNFVPGIIIGGVLGRLTGEVLAGAKVPGSGATDFPGVMALVGATAVLGGMTRMTLTIAVILTEITDDVHLLPTIMLALAISKAIGDRISPSFDDGMIRLMRLPMLEDAPPAVLEPLVARDVMAGPVLTLKEQLT